LKKEGAESLLKVTTSVLLINPECYAALNVRKELLNRGFVTPSEELKLMNLIFTKHPKSGEVWAHRF
jgi:protein prenyltransferase alpha subunit repeat containing protein 1